MKQICIIGLGRFGSHLARTLAKLDCEVLAIDHLEEPVNNIKDFVQRALILDGRRLEALQSVITPDIDEVVVSAAGNLESSILCTLHLKMIGVKRIHAKASSQDHAAILRAIGATNVIFPEWRVAEQMARQLVNPDLLDLIPLTQGYEVAEIPTPRAFAGKKIGQLDLRKHYQVFIIGLKDPGTGAVEPMPAADTVLSEKLNLQIIGKKDDIVILRQKFTIDLADST